ncbi:MAG: hypothetical protein E3J56_09615 [Candidatus Aminicenantes bacterium]|nr:MAG: hypothetical protein E3J56_09615 [Candidatus Aminicenantes bacterium]
MIIVNQIDIKPSLRCDLVRPVIPPENSKIGAGVLDYRKGSLDRERGVGLPDVDNKTSIIQLDRHFSGILIDKVIAHRSCALDHGITRPGR